jgi:hypothetical protein
MRLQPQFHGQLTATCVLVRHLIAIVIALGLLGAGTIVAADAAATEARVNAAFLINFPKYVEWPAAAFALINSPIAIAVVGESDDFLENGGFINLVRRDHKIGVAANLAAAAKARLEISSKLLSVASVVKGKSK